MRMLTMHGCFVLTMGLYAVSAHAAIIFNDDFESGLNTTDINQPNYWHPRFGSNVVPGLTTDQSVSPTHSMLNNNNPGGNNQWFAYVPLQATPTFYDLWVRNDHTQTGFQTEDVVIWNKGGTGYSEGVALRRTAGEPNFRYRANGANFVDTGIPYNTGTWYHIGFDMDPTTSKFDLYISTTEAFGAPVASGVSYVGGDGVGRLFFYSDSAKPLYYIDNVKITAIPEPQSVALLACAAGLLLMSRHRRGGVLRL